MSWRGPVIAFAVITYFIENASKMKASCSKSVLPTKISLEVTVLNSCDWNRQRSTINAQQAPGENQSFCSRHTPLLYSYSPPDGQKPPLPFDNLWRPVSAYSFSWYFEVLPKAVNSALQTTPEILPAVHRDHTCQRSQRRSLP